MRKKRGDSLNSKENYSLKADKNPYVKFGATWVIARPIVVRPRDGKKCDCLFCFGVCELKGKGSFVIPSSNSGDAIVETDSSTNNSATFYLLNVHPEAESEFIVDDTVIVPVDSIDGYTNLESFEILPGIYEYDETSGEISFDGQTVTYVGKVEINILVEEL